MVLGFWGSGLSLGRPLVCVVFSLVGLKRVLFTTIFTGFKEPPSFKVSSGQPDMYTQTPGRIQKVDPLMGVPIKYP